MFMWVEHGNMYNISVHASIVQFLVKWFIYNKSWKDLVKEMCIKKPNKVNNTNMKVFSFAWLAPLTNTMCLLYQEARSLVFTKEYTDITSHPSIYHFV